MMARIKLIIPEKKVLSVKIPVRISDINYGNHVGNDALVSIVHEARIQWLAAGNYSELNISGPALIMSDLAVEYKSESFYGDILSVGISVGEVQKKSFEVYYKMTAERSGKEILIAKAKTGMVCYDYEEKKVAAMPEGFVAFLTSTE